jgi:hypothetical protein
VFFGARVRAGATEPSIWRRLEPDVAEWRRFVNVPAIGKVVIITPSGLAGLAANPDVLRAINPVGEGDEPYIDLGEGGALLTGGGLKGLPQYTSSREALTELGRVFRARRDGQLVSRNRARFTSFTEHGGTAGI